MGVRALKRPPDAVASDPDAALVAAARLDGREYLALYDRYVDRVLGHVRARVADPDTCEDVYDRRKRGMSPDWRSRAARWAPVVVGVGRGRLPPGAQLPGQAADSRFSNQRRAYGLPL
jgi:hypothetical protein